MTASNTPQWRPSEPSHHRRVKALRPFAVAISALFVANLIVRVLQLVNVNRLLTTATDFFAAPTQAGAQAGLQRIEDIDASSTPLLVALVVTWFSAAILLGVWAVRVADNHLSSGKLDDRPITRKGKPMNDFWTNAAMALRPESFQFRLDKRERYTDAPTVRWWAITFWIAFFVTMPLNAMTTISENDTEKAALDKLELARIGVAVQTLILLAAAVLGIMTMFAVGKLQAAPATTDSPQPDGGPAVAPDPGF